MVNMILPHVAFDLISYSCWDATVIGGDQPPELLRESLDYIARHAIDSEYFGSKNIFIGEFGMPENDSDEQAVKQVVQDAVETGLAWGCPYIVYWQLYCNEPLAGTAVPSSGNDDSRGFWLIRADGTKPAVYDYFKDMLK